MAPQDIGHVNVTTSIATSQRPAQLFSDLPIHDENIYTSPDREPPTNAYREDEVHRMGAAASKLKSLAESDVDIGALCDALFLLWRLNRLLTTYIQRKRVVVAVTCSQVNRREDRPQPQGDITLPSCLACNDRLAALAEPLPEWPLRVAVLPSAAYFSGRGRDTSRHRSSGALSTEGEAVILLTSTHEVFPLKGVVETNRPVPQEIATSEPVEVASSSSFTAPEGTLAPFGPSDHRDIIHYAGSSGASSTAGSFAVNITSPTVSPSIADRLGIWHRAKKLLAWPRKRTNSD